MTELEAMTLEKQYLQQFLNGDWLTIPEQTLFDLVETCAFDFSLDHPQNKFSHSKRISYADDIWTREKLSDAVMVFSYSSEPINLSISRLAKAARFLGFSKLTPYATAVTYSKFKSLGKEYQKGNK